MRERDRRRRGATGGRHRPGRGRTKDTRTTREVETSRSFTNKKPYRTPALKKLAREEAVKVNGAWVSTAPTLSSPSNAKQRER